MNDEQLTYCPLCGSDRVEITYDETTNTWGAICNFCYCNVCGYTSEEAAIKRWNHRFNPDK